MILLRFFFAALSKGFFSFFFFSFFSFFFFSESSLYLVVVTSSTLSSSGISVCVFSGSILSAFDPSGASSDDSISSDHAGSVPVPSCFKSSAFSNGDPSRMSTTFSFSVLLFFGFFLSDIFFSSQTLSIKFPADL